MAIVGVPASLREKQRELAEAPACADLLADAVEALEAGRPVPAFAAEEVLHLLERRPAVAGELRRRRALRVFRQVAAENPQASLRVVATIAARKTGELADTLRRWDREAPDLPHDAGEAAHRQEAS